jgi:hypothetical protein
MYDKFALTPEDQRSYSQLNILQVLSEQSISALQPLFQATFTCDKGILLADGEKVSLTACLASSTDQHTSGAREPLPFGVPALISARVDVMRSCLLLQIKEEHWRGKYGQQGAISLLSQLSNAK